MNKRMTREEEWRAETAEIIRQAEEKAKSERFAEVHRRAIESGEPTILSVTTAPCNGEVENCTIDLIEAYVRPDGSTYTERVHAI